MKFELFHGSKMLFACRTAGLNDPALRAHERIQFVALYFVFELLSTAQTFSRQFARSFPDKMSNNVKYSVPPKNQMRMIDGIPVWGTPDEGAVSQIKTCAKTADRVALMADNHKGYAVPIGGVVAYKDSISPSGVGFDIACGNKAVLLDIPGSEIRNNISKIMDDVFKTISFGIGQRNSERLEHSLFDSPSWKVEA